MTKRRRLVLAACTGFVGMVVLAYWFYGQLVSDAFIRMFEDLGLEPQVTEDPWFGLLPYLGGGLIVGAVAMLLFPLDRGLIEKADQ